MSKTGIQKTVTIAGFVVMLMITGQEVLDLCYSTVFFDTSKYDRVFWLQIGAVFVIPTLISFNYEKIHKS